MIIGTCHFVSRAAAFKYYKPYFGPDTNWACLSKFASGEIKFGPPEYDKNKYRLLVVDDGTRYALEEIPIVTPPPVYRETIPAGVMVP